MTGRPSTEPELLLRLAQGDASSFEQLYQLYSRTLLRKLQFLLRDRDNADEILQETFVRVWENRAMIDLEKGFGGYLHRIARNLVADHYKRLAYTENAVQAISDSGTQNSMATDYVVRRNEMQRIINEAIDLLPPARRKAFTLCKIEGKTHEEAGEIMQISKNTVHNHLVKAMDTIRRHLSSRAVPYFIMIMAGISSK